MTDARGYRSRFLKLVIAIVAVVATVLSGAPAASAKCKPGRTNDDLPYLDGWYRTSCCAIGGVYSDIYNYSPWVVSPYGWAWSMLTIPPNEWAQVGWLESTGGVRHTFVQWTNGGYYYTKLFNPQPVGSFSYYTTLWNNTPGDFTFQVAGNTIDKETADFTPHEAEIMGEISSLANQMPGARDNNENFTDSHVYINGWQNFNGTVYNPNGNYFGNSRVDNYIDDIWDWACQY